MLKAASPAGLCSSVRTPPAHHTSRSLRTRAPAPAIVRRATEQPSARHSCADERSLCARSLLVDGRPRYFHPALEAADKVGSLIEQHRMLSMTYWLSAVKVRPGVTHVLRVHGGYPLAEINGASSDRAKRLAEIFEAGGVESPVLKNMRSVIVVRTRKSTVCVSEKLAVPFVLFFAAVVAVCTPLPCPPSQRLAGLVLRYYVHSAIATVRCIGVQPRLSVASTLAPRRPNSCTISRRP